MSTSDHQSPEAGSSGSSGPRDYDRPLPVNASEADRKAFTQYNIETLSDDQWSKFDVWEIFTEQFQHFSVDNFHTLPITTKTKLRNTLLERGVNLKKSAGYSIAKALAEARDNAVGDALLEEEKAARQTPVAAASRPSSAESPTNPLRSTAIPLAPTPGPVGAERSRQRTEPLEGGNLPGGLRPLQLRPSHQTWRRSTAFTDPPQAHQGNTSTAFVRELTAEQKEQCVAFSKLSANLAKLVTDADKYSGDMEENFDLKLQFFISRCRIAGIVDSSNMASAFSMMLKGEAMEYHLERCHGLGLTFEEQASTIRQRFYTEERTFALAREWDRISLSAIIASNPDKPILENFNALVAKLRRLQASLPLRKGDDNLRHALINSTMGVKACASARTRPSQNVQSLISDFQSSIAEWQAEQDAGGTTLYVDRHYNNSPNRYAGQRITPKGARPSYPRQGPPQGSSPRFHAKCYVCGKENCRSWKHPRGERRKVAEQFFAMMLDEVEEEDSNKESSDESDAATPPDPRNDDGAAYTMHLSDSSVFHALTGAVSPPIRYGATAFKGIMIDTGSNRYSTAGKAQYEAYRIATGKKPPLLPSMVSCAFGMGATSALGAVVIPFPFSDIILEATFHIVKADIPFILCLKDMDELGVHYNNLTNRLTHEASGRSIPVVRDNDHPFIRWNMMTHCLLTETELRRLHRRFGHPSAEKLHSLLRRADITDATDPDLRQTLEAISRECEACQRNAQAPRRFKFAYHDEKEFNHTIYVDVFYLNGRPVLHVVDEATKYQAARWLSSVSAAAIWQSLRLCWIDVYIGPPDIIAHDAGKGFVADEFQASSEMLRISTKPIPVESPQSMATVERYHASLRKAYNIIAADSPEGTDPAVTLQAAVKAVNDSVGPEGLIPTLLVYGALPKLGLPTDLPAQATYKRAAAVRKATEELSRSNAKAVVSQALRTRNGPDVSQHVLRPGMQALLWRRNARIPGGRWEGPFTIASIEDETCTLLLPSGPTAFRSTVVRPFIPQSVPQDPSTAEDASNGVPRTQNVVDTAITTTACMTITSTPNGSLEVFLRDVIRDDPARFREARDKEIKGLLARGTFTVVPASDAAGQRIYGGRFVDEVKEAGTPHAYEKSRFVVQGFNDRDHGLLTHAPTVHRASQRICLALCAQDPSFRLFSRDISQAYLQSKTAIQRDIFVRPPVEMDLPAGKLLRVDRALYGIAEAGMHWFETYHSHHTDVLGMIPAAYDPCLLHTPQAMKPKSGPRGITCIQTDDTINVGNGAFLTLEKQASRRFQSKERQILAVSSSLSFNGMNIELRNDGNLFLHQHNQLPRLKKVKKGDKEGYIAQRARGAYIASVCAPSLSYGFSAAAQVLGEPKDQDVTFLNRHIQRCKKEHGLVYKPLRRPFHMAVFVDAAFANNRDLSSQLGYITALMDDLGTANIIHYSSQKSKRITRSALAAELYAMVHGFDNAAALKAALDGMEVSNCEAGIPMVVYTDSRSLYDSLVSLNTTTEKRLLIDLHLLRQSYERREIAEIKWIPTEQNPADAFTKERPTAAMADLLSGTLRLTPNAWVDRPQGQGKGRSDGQGNVVSKAGRKG